jgi:hypothetical protein
MQIIQEKIVLITRPSRLAGLKRRFSTLISRTMKARMSSMTVPLRKLRNTYALFAAFR